MSDLTVFTPTYNRLNLLENLYNSLKNQTSYNFEWLIIDDGSNDGTQDTVKRWMNEEEKFSIQYHFQKNSGKHVAYNYAIKNMTSKWHVTVDSDDELVEGAIATFYRELKFIEETPECIGIVFPKTNKKTEKQEWIPTGVNYINIPDIKLKYNLNIETCILIRNEAIKQFRFPVFYEEKFMGEEPLYIFLAEKGYFYPCLDEVYEFEYLENGWTNNIFDIWVKNPQSTMYVLKERHKYICSNYYHLEKLNKIIKVRLNIGALRLKCAKKLNQSKIDIWDYLLLPLYFIWKKIRFNEK